MKEMKDSMHVYKRKMEEIEGLKNDEEVFNRLIIIDTNPFVYRLQEQNSPVNISKKSISMMILSVDIHCV
jgi:hypothetical protein